MVRFVVCVSLVAPALVAAAPRAKLSEAAKALVGKGMFLVPADNLAVPITGGKPVPLVEPAPQRVEIVAAPPSGEALLWIDGDVYRLGAGGLHLAAAAVGAQVSASSDGKVFVGVEDKKAIKVTGKGAPPRTIKYRRPGRWELERPWITPDGARVLVTLKDYTNPLDEYFFLALEVAKGEPEEIALSKTFVPGALRQPLGGSDVLIQMFSQGTDDDGVPVLKDAGLVAFDFTTRKLHPPPASVLPGRTARSGKIALLPGPQVWGEGHQCSGDETALHVAGQKKPVTFRAGPATVVALLDILPDEKSLVASVLDLKACRHRGVLIPIAGELPAAKWPPFPLPPLHDGRIAGRVIPAQSSTH